MNPQMLKELGMDKASEKLQNKIDAQRKMNIAYKNFKFVTPGVINKFNIALRNKTIVEEKYSLKYDKLVFIPLNKYPEVPPPDCLLDIKKAKTLECFDSFEVAKIEAVVERKDPIIFGCINGCQDKFFVTQWDDDVSFEEIMKHGENNGN